MNLEKVLFGGAIISTILFVILSTTGNTELIEKNDSWLIEETCLGSHSSDISHTHSSLSIFIDGSEVLLSANIGIQDSECPEGMRGIHTHDDTGKLHIETPNQIHVISVMPGKQKKLRRVQLSTYQQTCVVNVLNI